MSTKFSKEKKIKILSQYRDEADALKGLRNDNSKFKEWQRNTKTTISQILDQAHAEEFARVNYYPGSYSMYNPEPAFQAAYVSGLESAIALLNSMIKEIEDWYDDFEPSPIVKKDQAWAVNKLCLLMNRFSLVAKQLRKRHDNRNTLDVEDEYDVQDLFHSLLHLFFDDIRPEEWAPSYAGRSSRMDFLLDDYEIVVEIKMTRKGLTHKEVGEQLTIDKAYYGKHSNCMYLICFVYDPDGRIGNPRGFEKDLRQDGPLKTDVYVVG